MRMTNREKFREVYGFDTDCGKCNPYPCKEDDCEWWEQCKNHPGCPCENWWDLEYKAPTTKNNLAHNLCDSCTNSGCEFQSGIVRTKCAFYMPSITLQEPKTGHWIRVDKDKLRCSKCDVIHFIAQYPQGKIVWCPNCGAKNESEEK